jgi:hypothetical protein
MKLGVVWNTSRWTPEAFWGWPVPPPILIGGGWVGFRGGRDHPRLLVSGQPPQWVVGHPWVFFFFFFFFFNNLIFFNFF